MRNWSSGTTRCSMVTLIVARHGGPVTEQYLCPNIILGLCVRRRWLPGRPSEASFLVHYSCKISRRCWNENRNQYGKSFDLKHQVVGGELHGSVKLCGARFAKVKVKLQLEGAPTLSCLSSFPTTTSPRSSLPCCDTTPRRPSPPD